MKRTQRFLLIRHGESTANAAPMKERVVDARLTDAYLTAAGEAQAKSIGKLSWSKFNRNGDESSLSRGFSPELVVVSPFTRTLQTVCHMVAQWGVRPPIFVEPLIREYFPKFIPEIIGRPQNWLRACTVLQQLDLFPELCWDYVPEGNAQWWSPSGKQELDTVDLSAGKQRMRDFIVKMEQQVANDIVVVAHGTALGRSFRSPPGERLNWGNCEARLCIWSHDEERFVQIDHPDFPLSSLHPESATQHSPGPGVHEPNVAKL